MFIVNVIFRAKPDCIDAFREVILQQASSSLANEAGCKQFDVSISREDPTLFLVYEIYDDEAAFEIHRSSEHSARCRAAIGDLLAERDLKTWTLIKQ